jgi:FKBP-type peptidyl-prolyl cis-trans isomerase
MLKDGTIFDSSKNYSNNDGPMSFVLGSGLLQGKNIIFKFIIKYNLYFTRKGWELGLTDMCEGEIRKLKVPPSLGFGEKGDKRGRTGEYRVPRNIIEILTI